MKLRHILRLSALLLAVSTLTGCFGFGGGSFFDTPQNTYDNNLWTQETTPIPTASEGALWDLQANETCFVLNTQYETCFTVCGYGVSEVSLVYDGQTVCPMVDDGTDGDALAGDGIFTCTVNNSGDTAGADELYAVSGDLISAPVTLHYFDYPTEEALLTFEGAQLTVRGYIANAADSNGFVAPEDVPEVLSQAEYFLSNLYDRGEVLYYNAYDTHITAKFASGLTAVYAPPLEGVDANGGDVSVYTFQPFYDNYHEVVDPYLDFPDRAAQLIHSSFSNYEWNGNNDENAVTLESVRRFGSDEVILWHGHGGYDEALGPFLVTGERYDRANMMQQTYFEDAVRDRVIVCMDNRMAFTAAFVEERCGSMDGSFLYLASCESGKDSRLADAFLSKGATAVVANTNTIHTIYNLCMQYQTVEYMTQLNPATADLYTLEEALKKSMEKLGENDYSFSRNPYRDAHPVIFGAEDYQFGNVWSGVFQPTETEPPTTEPTTEPTEPPTTEPTEPPTAAPTEPAVGDPYADYKWFLESYTWVDYVASDLSEIPADQYADFWMGNYSLYDVNRDGVDELIIKCGQSISDTSYNFYSWKDGEIYVIGAIFAESGLYGRYDGAAGILVRNAQGDIETLTCVDMSWDGLTARWQKEYYYQREDYVDPKTDWYWIETYSVHDTSILDSLAN